VREATHQEYFCHADAAAAAAKLRALQSAYHGVQVDIEERPQYGPGRPSRTQPRRVKAWRYGLQVTLHERSEVIARKTQETGCFVLLTNVPTAGEMAHRAGDMLRAYKEQHGIEQNFGFLKDPLWTCSHEGVHMWEEISPHLPKSFNACKINGQGESFLKIW